MRRANVWLLGFALLIGLPAPGKATVREWLMERAGINPTVLRSTPSVRLYGMGDPILSVRDEANELNAHDFGGNIAGLLADSDDWVLESWIGNHRQDYERAAFSSERRYGHAGFHAVYRGADRALGAEVNWTYFQSNDADGDWRRVRGPLISALVNQEVGPVTLGLIVGTEHERESLITTDFFGITHKQDRWIGQLGAATELFGLQLGAGWDFEAGEVLGMSEDPDRYHEDSYTWQRPLDRYSFFAILPLRGRLTGGVRASTMDREGDELAEISWSDDSPQNPSGTDYFGEAITFAEEERETRLSTRWRFELQPGTLFGLEVGYRETELDVVEAVNFKGSRRGGYRSDEGLFGGLGVSGRFFTQRLLVALEGRGALEDWEIADEDGFAETGSARSLGGGLGAEYFVHPYLVVRAGVWAFSHDRDVDRPLTLSLQQSYSGGFSWLPQGGLMQLHGGVRFDTRSPDESQAPLEDSSVVSYMLGFRLLP